MPRRDPSAFTSTAIRPADFDVFWAETLRSLDRVPPNVTFTRDDFRSDETVEVFDVRYDSYGGLRIAGWFTRPIGWTSPLPGLLIAPGYVSEPKIPKDWARLGYAAFSVAPRGKLRSNSEFNPGYPGLLTHNITDRDNYAYRGFYMDAVRAFDILAGLPEVDARRVGVTGSSQGGALTLLVAALRADSVAAAAAGAPYLCSYMDAASLTHSYPYEEINEYLRIYPEREPLIRGVLDYYDIHHFAPAIRAPVIVNIGLQDDVCPPETGFALFEQIGSADKKLYPYNRCAHDAGSLVGHDQVVQAFLSLRLKPEPVAKFDPGDPPPATAKSGNPENTENLTVDEFNGFWEAVDGQVRSLSYADVALEPLPLRSTEGSTAYTIRLPSIGEGRVFGYFSVPNGDGPFPGLLEAPGYGSVVHISPYGRRQRYAVLTLVHRGQRLADEEYAAAYPGLLTDGLESEGEYRYRDIIADVLTGLDWLAGRPEIEGGRLAVAGSEAGLMAASMRSDAVRAVLLSGPLILRSASGQVYWSDSYPLEELNDYVHAHPENADKASRTLAYFDPVRFAPGYTGEVLLACAGPDSDVASPLVSALGGPAELYVNSGRGRDDREYAERWLNERLTG
ncbi:MAG: acetylxylan esterase [Chloroflexi bacterium]|nr:acetylxylan esterase [Chloroflexota bacterium]